MRKSREFRNGPFSTQGVLAACREMLEETGLRIDHPGPQVARRTTKFQLPSGELVSSDERYSVIRVEASQISGERWTDLEREVIAQHRWWSPADLRRIGDQVWPENLAQILIDCGAWDFPSRLPVKPGRRLMQRN